MSKWSRRIPGPNVAIEVDFAQVEGVIAELKSTEGEIGKAISYALRRTATSLAKMSRMRLQSELAVQKANTLRRRMKTMKARIKGADSAVPPFNSMNSMVLLWPKSARGSGRFTSDPGVDGSL